MRSTVVLKGMRARYVCKAAFFVHDTSKWPGMQPTEIGPDGKLGYPTHAVTIKYPRKLNQEAEIIDPNFENTNPDPRARCRKPAYTKVGPEDEGRVGGLLFLRTNHPSDLDKAAKRRADYYRVI
jgi:hypothetical protein